MGKMGTAEAQGGQAVGRDERQLKKRVRAVQSITDPYAKVSAVTDLVKEWWVGLGEDRVCELVADAERAAWSITSEKVRTSALAHLAVVVSSAGMWYNRYHRAESITENIALSITREDVKSSTLAELAIEDQARSVGLSDRANRIARSIPIESTRAQTLAKIEKLVRDREAEWEERKRLEVIDPSWGSAYD
jgi:hypothetical protein